MKAANAYLPANGEETEFCRHIRDISRLSEKTFTPKFSEI